MPMNAVTLRPGVNVERTLSANEAGVSISQLLRWKDQMFQTLGGWQSVFTTIPSTVRDLHAWQDINQIDWLSAAATNNLIVQNSSASNDVTPQTRMDDFTPSFSVSSGSQLVTILDPNSGVSIYDTIFFNTPIAVGGLLLNGAYNITSVLSTGSYTITSSVAATATVSSGGLLPVFTTSSGLATVSVALDNNNFQAIPGLQQTFFAPTTVGGLTIQGHYNIASIVTSTNFLMNANTLATGTATSTMNGGLAEIVYYVALGPQATGGGFGAGGFGSGGYGSGSATVGTGGTPISAQNWTQDNWGEILLSCPYNGAIFAWSPDSGLQNSQVVGNAPIFNGGIFISMPQQILVAWKSCQSDGGFGFSSTQDNLIVRWSDAEDFTNWAVTNQTSAGSFKIPTGSIIMGGLQAPNRGVIWTDIDVWSMQYIGGDLIFNFTKVGTGCGLVGPHAAGVIGGGIYWCGLSNFFFMGDSGAQIIPCTVWDKIFQNLNTSQKSKIVCAPNSAFNEISWFFPSTGATENDSYVKLNLNEGEWDYGLMNRTAWTDVSVVGNPIGADSFGVLNQHETSDSQTGTPVTSMQTGWWTIAEGNNLSFVDFVIPDFKWSQVSGSNNAQINITFYSQDYPGDNPVIHGPYTVTQQTQYIATRIRGRLMSMSVQSNNNVFWRIGKIRYRFAPAGRR